MKRLRFSLNAVFAIQTRMEKEALKAYARSLGELREAERATDALHSELAELVCRIRKTMREGDPTSELTRLRHYERYLQHRHDGSLQVLREASFAAQRTLQKVLASRRAREAVDQLRNRPRQRGRRAMGHEHRRMIHELAAQKAGLALGWQDVAEVFP